jgi:hypothetical protein
LIFGAKVLKGFGVEVEFDVEVSAAPDLASEWLAESFALQAQGDLLQAREAARTLPALPGGSNAESRSMGIRCRPGDDAR